MHELKDEEGFGLAIVIKPKEETKAQHTMIPKELQHILDHFRDIISDGTLATLSPQREISHQIYFVPGASFPNKVAYKMTLDQNKEIAR